MAINRIAISNLEELKTPLFKEKDFNPDFSDPLFDFYKSYDDPDYATDPANGEIAPTPDITGKRGLSVDSFVEKPVYLPTNSYYYAMDQDLGGKTRAFNEWNEIQENSIANVEDKFEIFSNSPLINVYGAQPIGPDKNLIKEVSSDNWTQNCTFNALEFNPIMDNKGLRITNNTANDVFFVKEVVIEEEGYYCFSGYFRLFGNDALTTKIFGLHFSPTSSNITEAVNNNYEHFYILDLPYETYNSRDYFTIRKEWTQVAVVSYLPAGHYNAVIFWPQNVNGNNKNTGDELRVCGLRVDKGLSPLPLEYRTSDAVTEEKQFLLLFNFFNIVDMYNDDWSIYYYRYLKYNRDHADCYDSLGSIEYGFKNNKIVIGGVEKETEADFYNNWGINILTHKDGALTFRTIGRFYDEETEPFIPPSPQSLQVDLYDISFNLSLGASISTTSVDSSDVLDQLLTFLVVDLNQIYIDDWRDRIWPEPNLTTAHGIIYSGVYRDLIFLPRALTDEDINRIKSDLIGLSRVVGYEDETESIVTLRATRFSEGSYGI